MNFDFFKFEESNEIYVLVHPRYKFPQTEGVRNESVVPFCFTVIIKATLDCRRVFQLPRLTIRGNRDFETFAHVTFAGIEASFSAVRKSPMETTRESTRQFLVHSYKCFAFESNETYGHEFTVSRTYPRINTLSLYFIIVSKRVVGNR